MKRWFAILAPALAVGLIVAGGVLPAGSAGAAPRSQLRAATCHNALDPLNRSLSVTAVMRSLPGTQKLQLRFDVLTSADGSGTQTSVHAGNLGKWITPRNPTLGQLPDDVWNFRKTVSQLAAPASYRVRVSFRWIGSGNRVLGSAVRYTKPCHQGSDLMVLTPVTVSAVAGDPNQDRYTALILNRGPGAAGPFVTRFVSGDGSVFDDVMVQGLAAKKTKNTRSVSFLGPACSAAAPPTITADATLQVDDLNRANNSVAVACPSGSTGG